MGLFWRRRKSMAWDRQDIVSRCRRDLRQAGWRVDPGAMGFDLIATRNGMFAKCICVADGPVTEASLRRYGSLLARREMELHLVVEKTVHADIDAVAKSHRILIVPYGSLLETLDAFPGHALPTPAEAADRARATLPPDEVDDAVAQPEHESVEPRGEPEAESGTVVEEVDPRPLDLAEARTTRILENDFLEIYLRDAPGDITIIAFSPLHHYADGATYWGQALADQLDLRWIGIISKDDTWFPEIAMRDGIDIIRRHLRGHVVLYGSSMGGYGALKYSRALGADTVIAFAPQATIASAELPGNTYAHLFRRELHSDMRIKAEDLAGRQYIFVDPWFREDLAHLALIPAVEGREIVTVPSLRHSTLSIAVGTKNFSRLLPLCVDNRRAELDRAVREIRRETADTFENLALHLAERRKPNWARRAIVHSEAIKSRPGRVLRFYVLWLAALEKQARSDDAIEIADEAIGLFGPDPELLYQLGGALLQRKSFERAAEAFAGSITHGGRIAASYHGYVHAMIMIGKRDDALPLVLRGIELCPHEPSLVALRELLPQAAPPRQAAAA